MQIFESLFALLVVILLLFWIMAKINKKGFLDYFNETIDKITGRHTPDIEVSLPKLKLNLPFKPKAKTIK